VIVVPHAILRQLLGDDVGHMPLQPVLKKLKYLYYLISKKAMEKK